MELFTEQVVIAKLAINIHQPPVVHCVLVYVYTFS
jgi:hypothetical protein